MKPIFRKDKIVDLCKDKSVLHLGFIQHSHLYEDLIRDDNWLHKKLDGVSKELVGLDYLKDDVKILREKYGYEAHYADVTRLEELKLDKKFDVIVCGELIEHITNAGNMLEGIKSFMHEESILIITTPNPWAKDRIRLIRRGILEDKWLNPEHTCWYSFGTLKQLLERLGYIEEKYTYSYRDNSKLYYKNMSGIKKITNFFRFRNTPLNQYDGLFFISKLENKVE